MKQKSLRLHWRKTDITSSRKPSLLSWVAKKRLSTGNSQGFDQASATELSPAPTPLLVCELRKGDWGYFSPLGARLAACHIRHPTCVPSQTLPASDRQEAPLEESDKEEEGEDS